MTRDLLEILKAHAYGNDFLYARADAVAALGLDPVALARHTCARHTGIGADGLILFTRHGRRRHACACINADGSPAEVSGNGVRGLAALVAQDAGLAVGGTLRSSTPTPDRRRSTLVSRDEPRTRRLSRRHGPVEQLARTSLDVGRRDASTR